MKNGNRNACAIPAQQAINMPPLHEQPARFLLVHTSQSHASWTESDLRILHSPMPVYARFIIKHCCFQIQRRIRISALLENRVIRTVVDIDLSRVLPFISLLHVDMEASEVVDIAL